MQLNDLVGITIIEPLFDGEDIYLKTKTAIYHLYPSSYCCENCFIKHVNFSEALYNATVINIEDLESKDISEKEDIECIEEWGHRIITDKGICTIEMRVEHNGYYGGSLEIDKRENIKKEAKLLTDF